MKCELHDGDNLVITPESVTEEYALTKWVRVIEEELEGGDRVVVKDREIGGVYDVVIRLED